MSWATVLAKGDQRRPSRCADHLHSDVAFSDKAAHPWSKGPDEQTPTHLKTRCKTGLGPDHLCCWKSGHLCQAPDPLSLKSEFPCPREPHQRSIFPSDSSANLASEVLLGDIPGAPLQANLPSIDGVMHLCEV